MNNGKLYVHFRSRGYLYIPQLWHTVLAGGWKFVGASYDYRTGDANLWVNGAVVYTRNIGIGLDLATNDSIRMGAYDRAYFKGRIAQMQVYDKALTQEQMTKQNVQWKHAGFRGYHIGYLLILNFCIKIIGRNGYCSQDIYLQSVKISRSVISPIAILKYQGRGNFIGYHERTALLVIMN